MFRVNLNAGKFAQRSGLSQTKIFDDPAKVYKLLQSIDNIRLINEEIVEVTYKEDGAFARVNPNTNVVVAAFTTCHARLKLYKVLEKLGDRVLYQDTGNFRFFIYLRLIFPHQNKLFKTFLFAFITN